MITNIPDDAVEKIRRENDIVEVIEEYVQLKKQGRSYFGICPFHNEKSPSFSVTKEKQIFHCFGCGKGGNVITFLMEIENITFLEAVQHLAKRINFSLPIMSQKTVYSDEANTLFAAYDWLTKYYHHMLKYSDEGKKAKEYLINRGINAEIIDQFQLGYAPTDSEYTLDFLRQKEFHLAFLAKVGILSTRDQQNYVDIFRGRVIFPILNHLGKTVAFGGRALNQEEPKYLNSAEHELFQKNKLLYNFSKARSYIRKQNEAIVFEGYLDVLAADGTGIKNVVATLGTALTKHQAMLLHRYVEKVILCYDGDEAGIQATYQAAQILQDIGCQVKIARLKDGMDPDDYIRTFGGEKFKKEIIDVSDTFFRFFMNFKKREYNMAVDSERIAYVEMITKQLAMVESAIEREYYLKEIADEFQLSEEIISHDIQQYRNRNIHQFKDKRPSKSNTNRSITISQNKFVPAFIKAERLLIAYMLKHYHVIDIVQEELGVNFNINDHKVILTHLYAIYEEKSSVDVSELIDKIYDPHLQVIITELAVLDLNDHISDGEIADYIELIKKEASEFSQLRILKQKQKDEKNPILAAKIGLEIIELEKKIKSLS